MLLLKAQKTTRVTFKVDGDLEGIKRLLNAAYAVEVDERGRKFEPSEEKNTIFCKVAEWLHELKKDGLLVCGLCGNGKTTLLRAIRTIYKTISVSDGYNGRVYVNIVSARDIARLNIEELKRLANENILAIDDLGTEPVEVMNFGNLIEPIKQLVEERYDKRMPTIISTNLEPKRIRELYGDRIADRFNEMMEKIVFTKPSYR